MFAFTTLLVLGCFILDIYTLGTDVALWSGKTRIIVLGYASTGLFGMFTYVYV